ncbi:MAG: hypothetical protein K6F50_09135 [Kiritimatiellae bacterium]|nr:hypothetical protein [Kiritimatiellia bacterium]
MKNSLMLTAVLFAACMHSASAALSPEAADALKEEMPFAFYALPKGKASKVKPLVSDSKRRPDGRTVIDVKSSPMVLKEISADGKCVLASCPLPKDPESSTNAWFMAEDVLALGKAAPEKATAKEQMLLFSPWGDKRPALVGCVPAGTEYLDFGERKAGREKFRLALVSSPATVCGESVSRRLVYAREQSGKVTDAKSYAARIAEMMNEEPFRHGTFWDNTCRPLLVQNGNLGCAAFVTDFAKYVFGADNFNQGEKFENPSEIRAGDVISIKGHFLAVLDRNGDRLVTMEGNFCSAIWHSDNSYGLMKGGWVQSGKLAPDNFICGYHYLKEAPAKPLGIKPKRKK